MRNIPIKKIFTRTLGVLFLVFVLLFIISFFYHVKRNEYRSNLYPECFTLNSPDNVYLEVNFTEVVDDKYHISTNYCDVNKLAIDWTKEDPTEVTFTINVGQAGEYYIGIVYFSLNDTVVDNAISIKINDIIQDDADNMLLETAWKDESKEKDFDKYSNQLAPRQKRYEVWDYTLLRNQLRHSYEPVRFYLNQGLNQITITKLTGKFYLEKFYLITPIDIPSYKDYRAQINDVALTKGEMIAVEAENSLYKNDISVSYENIKTPSVTPYRSDQHFINIVGRYFNDPGQKITYTFEIKNPGFYHITLKYKNENRENINIYRNIYIDGKILFKELVSYPFPYTSSWTNLTLGDKEPFEFYFTKGIHTLSIEVDASHVSYAYLTINDMINEINRLHLQLNKITGGVEDTRREWNLDEYLPEAKEYLDEWINELTDILEQLEVINTNPKKSNEIAKKIENALDKLKDLRKDYNKLPNRIKLLAVGSNSVALTLSKANNELIDLPMMFDAFFIHSDDVKLPKANANFFVRLIAGMERLRIVAKPQEVEEDVLEVWMNRSRFYVDLLQKMVDRDFTTKTGIKVRISLMPNEQKLIMANAANTQPDVALSVSGWLPYDLGIRGAAADLRQFPDFYEVINNFQPGALLHMIESGKVYGLPETQDFYVTFYRKDIFEELKLPIPETYEEIINILPTLQRYGMNYYLPLSANSALKPYSATAPFIFQYGGDLYKKNDSLHTGIDSEQAVQAITMMTDLYTLYSLPLQVSNFYDSFRNGTIPIGVATFGTYVQLLFAAPELKGKWAIALAPGVRQEDGSINREYTGTAQSALIFEKSKKKQEAWEFLKWWLSYDVQAQFTYDLQLIYGKEYLWNSANTEAFKTLPIDPNDIQVILKQWESIREVPKTPGSYIIERELSNIWNKVVFNQENVRTVIDDAVIKINRELARKYREFDYMDEKGNIIRPYELPTVEMIRAWQELGKKDGDEK
ncbi:MAG: extracellular solute-binding protein [Bacilli bacterium]|nr:extracellular solute-binding protein [Bacilli bacterium]